MDRSSRPHLLPACDVAAFGAPEAKAGAPSASPAKEIRAQVLQREQQGLVDTARSVRRPQVSGHHHEWCEPQ